jgi:hypothetical protein
VVRVQRDPGQVGVDQPQLEDRGARRASARAFDRTLFAAISGLSPWIGPAAGDEVGVPAQQGSGGDEPQPPQIRGQQSAQGAEEGAVDPRSATGVDCVVSAQHGDLVTEDQDLDVFGCVGSGEQRQPTQHAGEQQVGES